MDLHKVPDNSEALLLQILHWTFFSKILLYLQIYKLLQPPCRHDCLSPGALQPGALQPLQEQAELVGAEKVEQNLLLQSMEQLILGLGVAVVLTKVVEAQVLLKGEMGETELSY